MHAKIIQVSTDRKMDWIKSDDFLEGFVGWIADYTDDLDYDTQSDIIDRFVKAMKDRHPDFVEIGENSISFLDGFEEDFAEKQVQALKEIVNSGKPYRDIRWKVQLLVEDYFGTWIYWDGMWTLEHWLSHELDGRTFYFGGVVDYHY